MTKKSLSDNALLRLRREQGVKLSTGTLLSTDTEQSIIFI